MGRDDRTGMDRDGAVQTDLRDAVPVDEADPLEEFRQLYERRHAASCHRWRSRSRS
jgi:hypothetical protein